MHGEQDIVAVCRSVPKRCDSISLTKADITVHELNWRALGAAIAEALAFTRPQRQVEVLPRTLRVGWHYLPGGRRVAVYLTIQHERVAIAALLSRLLAEVHLPFILTAPTADLYEGDSVELLRRMRVLLLPLGECLAWDERQGLVTTDTAETLLSDFAAAAPKATAQAPSDSGPLAIARVDVPRGATWDEVHLIMDDFNLGYEIRGKGDSLNFVEAGFEDQRQGGLPNDSWRLLRTFAKYGGRPPKMATDTESRRALKQRISKLRGRLQGLFRIRGQPIANVEPGTYATVFRIRLKDGITLTIPEETTWSTLSISETRSGLIRFTAETKERYLVFSDGRGEDRSKEVAERRVPITEERDLWILGLMKEDNAPNEAGQALLDTLRAGGKLRRESDDVGLLELGGLLCRTTGIKEPAFRFSPGRKEWVSEFEASSDRATR
jgi:hypothetical protein